MKTAPRTLATKPAAKSSGISVGFIASLSRSLALATLAAIGIGRADAAPLTFEGTTAPTPGNGFSWLDPLNWTGDILPTSIDDLTFGSGITGPILLGQNQTASSLTFTTNAALGAYGSDLGIALTSGNISVASGSLVSLNANYNGLAGLNLSGGGNLYMGNLSPDFAGNITVDGAGTTLIHKQEGPTNQYNGLGSAQEFGRFDQTSLGFTTALRTITLTNGGEYKIINSGNNSEGNYKNITIGSGGGTLNLAAGYILQNLDDAGQLAGTAGNTFTKAGKGRLVVTGTLGSGNPLAGPVVIDGGMLELGSITAPRFNGIATANTLTINNGGTIFLNNGTAAALDTATVIANNGAIFGMNGADHQIGLATGGSTFTVNGTVSILNRDLFAVQTQRLVRLHSELQGSGVLQLLGSTNAGSAPRLVVQRATPTATFNGTFRMMENVSLEANPRSNASASGGTGTVVDTGKVLGNGDIEFAGWGSTLDVRDSDPSATSLVLDYTNNEITFTTTQPGSVNTISNVRATAATGTGHMFNYGTLTIGNHYLQIQGNNNYQTGFGDTASIVGNARIRMNSDGSPLVFSNAAAISEDAAGRSITFIKSGQGNTGARDVIIGGNVSVSNFNVDFGTVALRGANGAIGTAFGGAAANILINGGAPSGGTNANPVSGLLHLDNNTGHVVGATTVFAAANNNDRISDSAVITMRGNGILRLTSASGVATTETIGTINANGHNTLDVVKTGAPTAPVALTVNTLNLGSRATVNLTGTSLGVAGANTSRIVIPGTATGFMGAQFHSGNEWAKYDSTLDNSVALGATPFLATDYTINATNTDAAWASGQQLKLTSATGVTLTADRSVARLNTQLGAANQNINLAGFLLTVEEGGIISSTQPMGFKDGATATPPSATAGVTAGTTSSPANLFVHANSTVEFHTPIRDNAAGGSVTFVKSGPGNVILSHQDRAVGAAQVGAPFTTATWSSSNTGGWVINDGALVVHRGQYLGATPTTVTLNGGQLELQHPVSTANADSILPGWGHNIVVNGNATVGADDNGEATDAGTGDRAIALMGSLTINNNSTLGTGTFSSIDIAYLGGTTINGRATFNLLRNDGNATTILGGAVTGGGFDLVGYNAAGGTLVLGGNQADSTNNTFNSGIVLLSGSLRLNKANGAVAIPDTADAEDVVINNGATLAWGPGHYGDLSTTNNINTTNLGVANGLMPTSPAAILAAGQNQIADTASITLLNGTLGNGDRIQNETFGTLTMKNGTFNVGLGSIAVSNATISGGAFNIDRGGSFSADTLTLLPGAPDLNITTGLPVPGAVTTLGVGSGGISLSGQNIILGTGSNGNVAGSGGVLKLGGNLTAVGSDLIGGSYGRKGIFINLGASFREIGNSFVDLDGGTRDFNIDTDVIFTVTAPLANGGLTKSGNGALVLEPYQPSSFTGAVTVNAGVLQAKGAGAFGTSAGGVTIASGGTVKLDSGWSYGDAFTVSGPGALIPGGDGVRELGALIAESGTNHLTGAVSISGNATLAGSTFLDPSVTPGAGGAAFRIGTLSVESAGGLTGTGNVTLSGPGDGVITNGVNTVGTVTKDGAGRWTLSGAGSYAGTTNVLAGVLRVGNANALGTTAAGTTVAGGGTLEVTGGISLAEPLSLEGFGANTQSGSVVSSTGANTLTGALVLNGATTLRSDSSLNVTGAITSATDSSLVLSGSGTGTISNSISTGVVGFDGITKTGTGTWTISGANNVFGSTSVRGGTLVLNYGTQNNDKVNAGSSVSFSGGDLTVQGHATFSTVQSVAGLDFLSGGATVTVNGGSNVAALDASSFTRNTGATVDFVLGTNGVVATSTPLTNGIVGGYATVGGTNWATVSGGFIAPLSTYTPLASATSSDNAIVSSSVLGGPVSVNSLKLTGLGIAAGANGVTTGGLLYTGSGRAGITGAGIVSGASPADEFIVNTASGLLDIAAPIIGAGGGSLTKAGNGTLMLSGSSAFTGNINITGGTLSIVGTGGTHPTALGSATGPRNINLNGGTFESIGGDYDPGVGTMQFVIGTGGGTIRSTLGANITINDATAPGLVPPAQLAGPGDLTFTGGGRYNLSGGTPQFRGFTGKVIVDGGILTLGHSFSAGGLQEQTITLKSGSAIINSTGYGLGQNGVPNNIVAESGVEFYAVGGNRAFGGDLQLNGTTTFALMERDNLTQERQIHLNGRVSGTGVTLNVVGVNNGNPLYMGSGSNDFTGAVNLKTNSIFEVRTPGSLGVNTGDVTVNLEGANSRLLLRHFQNGDYRANVNVSANSELNSDRLTGFGGGANQLLSINNLTSSTNGILSISGGNSYTTRVAGTATFSANTVLNTVASAGILFENGITFTGGASILDKRGGASVVLRGAADHTGQTIVQQGFLILQGGGTLSSTSEILLRGGELRVDNSDVAIANRLNDAAGINLGGGILRITGAETLGTVTANPGVTQVVFNPTSETVATALTLTGFNRNTGSIVQFQSPDLGPNTVGMATFGNSRVSSRILIPGQANTTQTIPGLLGNNGIDFIQYDGTTIDNGAPLGVRDMRNPGTVNAPSNYTDNSAETAWNDTIIARLTNATDNSTVTNTLTASRALDAIKIETGGTNRTRTIDLAANNLRIEGGGIVVATSAGTGLIVNGTTGVLTAGPATPGTGTAELFLGGNGGTITVNGLIGNNGSQSVALVKHGATLLTLNNANSYTGGTYINSGNLRVSNAGALGSSANPIHLNGGLLDVFVSATVNNENIAGFGNAINVNANSTFQLDNGAAAFTDQNLAFGAVSINGPYTLALRGFDSVDATFSGTHTMTGTPTLDMAQGNTGGNASFYTFSGEIAGSGFYVASSGNTDNTAGILQIGAGETTANTYSGKVITLPGNFNDDLIIELNKAAGTTAITGDIQMDGGVIRPINDNQIADTSTVVNNRGLLDFNQRDETIASLVLNGGGVVTNLTAAVPARTNVVTITGNVDVNGLSNFAGLATGLTVGNNSTLNIGGLLRIGTFGRVHLAEGRTGAVLNLNGGLEMTGSLLSQNTGAGANIIRLNSDVVTLASASVSRIGNVIDTDTFLDLNGTRSFTVADGGAGLDLVVSTNIRNSVAPVAVGGLVKNGPGVMQLEGAGNANTYSGPTNVNEGTLVLFKSVGTNATGNGTGTLTVGDGTGGAGADKVILRNSNQIADNTPVVVASSGLLDMESFNTSETIGSLAGDGSVEVGPGSVFTIGGATSTVFNGSIRGVGALVRNGAGATDMAGTSEILGGTTVSGTSTLLVSGSLTGAVTVTTGATIGGTGSIIGTLTAQTGGLLKPGAGIGQLDTGNLDLQTGSISTFELNGTIAGTQYDQLNTTGTVTLAGNLSLSIGFTPVADHVFALVLNDGSDAVNGIFSGLPEGSTVVSQDGYDYVISYVGNADGGAVGNDIILTIPEPGSALMLLGGLGLLAGGRRIRRRS